MCGGGGQLGCAQHLIISTQCKVNAGISARNLLLVLSLPNWCRVQVQIFFRMDDLSLAYTATVQTSAKTAAVDCKRSKFAHGQIFADGAISTF